MLKIYFLFIYVSLLIGSQSISDHVFEHSFNNMESQKSIYSFQIVKSQNEQFNYNINWTPTNNLIVNTNFINNTTDDNKVYYGINFGLVFSKNFYSLIIGMGINNLKFDAQFNKLQWINYFINNEFNIYDLFNINLGLSYYNNNQFSFFGLDCSLNKNIYKNLNVGLGSDLSMESFVNKVYFSISYSL